MALATANASKTDILQAGQMVTYNDKSYMSQAGDSLDKIATDHFQVPLGNFLIGSSVLSQPGLLAGGAKIDLPLYATYQAKASDTFDTIAKLSVYGSTFTATQLATQNAARSILRSGQKISYPDKDPYTTQPDDSLDQVATALGVSLPDLLSKSGVLIQENLLLPVALLDVPPFGYTTQDGDDLQSVAARFNFSLESLSYQEANGTVADLFATTSGGEPTPYLDLPHLVQFQVAELIKEVQRSLAIQHLSGMTSRYYLHGMRLPTDGITPNQPGMWVKEDSGKLTLPLKAGLYALTGQQFPLPDIRGEDGFTITFDRSGGPDWLLFEDRRNKATKKLVFAPLGYTIQSGDTFQKVGAKFGVTADVLASQSENAANTDLLTPGAKITYPDKDDYAVKSGDSLNSVAKAFGVTLSDLLTKSNVLSLGGLLGPGKLLRIPPFEKADATRIHKVTSYARANRLDTDLTHLGPEQMYESHLASFPLTSVFIWQSAADVKLPYGTTPDGVPALRLWKLPEAMINLPDPKTRAINPRFSAQVGRYDEATGGTVKSPVSSYGWASTIEFKVKKISQIESSPTTKNTYEIIGAGGNDIVLMERLLDQVQGDDAFFDRLFLGYPPDQAGDASEGVQTDPVQSVTMGIAQVNLSTETRPPTSAFAIEEEPTGLGLLNKKSEFIRLLWEASITRAGGFYLYYYNSAEKSSLPDRIFNDKGEANLTLILLYSKPSSETDQNRLTDFMNALATGENIDTSNSVVFAQADPPTDPMTTVKLTDKDSLASIGYGYYTDIGDLAHVNADKKLATGKKVRITEGLYEVGIKEPGGTLSKIASHFGLGKDGVKKIKNANPRRTDWSDPLKLYTALRLPQMEVAVGTSPAGTPLATLGDFAAYYGENLTALAAHNRDIQGLFASDQKVVIPGGSRVRSATVPPGVAAVAAVRPVPPEVPDDPNAKGFARDFLLNTFSLLNYQVVENVDFKGSNMGLPAGPTTETEEPDCPDKIRAPKILKAGDNNWDYKQATPYPKFAKVSLQTVADLPDPKQNPYIGVGFMLQVGFNWQDLYGNTLVTMLSDPQNGDTKPLNRPPMLLGYTDALIGLGQWPSVSSGWQVLTGSGGGEPQLQVMLSFDDSRYQGLLEATASSATTVVAKFTEKLDSSSANNKDNYGLDNATIENAVLNTDEKTVELTVSPLSEGSYTVSVKDIKTKDGSATFQGKATFSYPDKPDTRSSTVQENAEKDLQVYTQLYYQLTDPNGIAYTIETSLLKGSSDQPTTIELTSQVQHLLEWLFNGTNSIYKFLQDRANFGTGVPVPPAENPITSDIDIGQLNDSQIFELSLAFNIERTGGAVLGDLETTPGIEQTSTPVAPLTQKLATEDSTLGLEQFARNFENALSQEGVSKLRVATGVNRNYLSPTQSGGAIWAVCLGHTASEAISYSINNPNNPSLFAPQPISNKLESRKQVQMFKYVTGTGLVSAPPQDFIDIDMDVWGRQFFAAIDRIMAPEFTAAIQIVGEHKNTDYLQKILDQKKALAAIIKQWMKRVFKGETTDPKNAQEAYYQQLLERLSNAYTTHAAVQFEANVNANIKDLPADKPPHLFGNIIQKGTTNSGNAENGGTESKSEISLTSPKLELETGSDKPLTFLLTAPDVVKGVDGQVVPNVTLDLTYNGTNIEHQIGSVKGIEGYVASSWLSFVIPDKNSPLTADLGTFMVPLVLRSFPTSPTMAAQGGTATYKKTSELNELTQWNYCFTYALPFHYPQDRIHCEVDFNIAKLEEVKAGFKDAFDQLAQFITVFPDVNKDLESILASIDATTDDPDTIDNAAIALESFITLVTNVTNAGLVILPRPKAFTSKKVPPYIFSIQEGSAAIESTEALLLTIHGQPPEGIGKPEVRIENYTMKPYDGPCEGDYCYWYEGSDGKPLSASVGQAIPDRQVVLPGMDILQRQDAWSTVYIKRNEELIPDKPTEDPFVYTTPNVQFANPLHPTLDTSNVVDISTIGSTTDPPQHITRSLEEHLTALFDALLKDNTQQNVTFQVDCNYDYTIKLSLDPVTLPVLMQPPLEVDVKGNTGKTLAEMISHWTQGIWKWFETHKPKPDNGVLWFDLTIMSNLTSQPMPLLRLQQLKLEIKYIKPEPPSF